MPYIQPEPIAITAFGANHKSSVAFTTITSMLITLREHGYTDRVILDFVSKQLENIER